MGCSKSSVPRGKFIAIQSYLKKQEKHQIDNLTLHLQEQKKLKNLPFKRRGKIMNIRAEINEKEMKETISKVTKTKMRFFQKINKTDNLLSRLIKKKREKTQINKIKS